MYSEYSRRRSFGTKEMGFILIPFIYGLLANVFLVILPPFISQVGFGIFWFWVGIQFAQLDMGRIKSFLLGNSLWALSFLVFLWQFYLRDDSTRSLLWAGLSQHYPLSFIWSGVSVFRIFSGNYIHGLSVVLIAHIVMLVIFSAGFVYGSRKGKA